MLIFAFYQVWSSANLSIEASFVGHKFGVSNVEFTQNSQYVISVSILKDIQKLSLIS